MKRSFILLVGVFMMVSISFAYADIPQALNFQGKVTDKDGNPLNGNYAMSFSLYPGAIGGTPLWSETQTVAVSNGVYSCRLGAATPLTLSFDAQYYLQVSIGGEILSPRQKLAASPYAFNATNAQRLAGVEVERFLQVTAGGSLGLGTNNPQAKLHVTGGKVVLDGGGNFTLYGAADNVEHNGYLSLINATAKNTAWGLKSGGVLVSDSYSYANPGKNTLIVQGNVGVGTPSPKVQLHVHGGAIRLTNPGSYPYGINIDMDFSGGWAREYSFTRNAQGKLFAFGVVGHNNVLTYGYIGGNSTGGTVHSSPWMAFTPNGNIGVGTKTPTVKLDIDGITKFREYTIFSPNNVDAGYIGRASSLYSGASVKSLVMRAADKLYLQAGNNYSFPHLVVNSNGYVGVGTATPSTKLDVKGGSFRLSDPRGYPYGINIDMTFSGGWAREYSFTRNGKGKVFAFGVLGNGENLTYGYIGGNTSSTLSYTAPWMVFSPQGNVGVGIKAPQEKLHVAGKVKAQEFITGDITFTNKETGKVLWRMFEDEEGLYLQSAQSKKVYRFVLEEVK